MSAENVEDMVLVNVGLQELIESEINK